MFLVGTIADAFILYGKSAKTHFVNIGIKHRKLFVAQNTVDTNEIIIKERLIRKNSQNIRKKYGLGDKKIILILTLKTLKAC